MSFARTKSGFLSIATAAALLAVFALSPTPLSAQEEDSEETLQTVGQYARHYRVYRRDIDILSDMSFMSASEVRNAYGLIMEYDPGELTRGWFAHQAIIASRAPGFMETVRTEARQRGETTFFSDAQRSPSYLWELSSTTAAINFVFDGLYQDAREARAVGQVLNDRAYAYMDRRYGSRLPSGSVENASELLTTDTPTEAVASGGRTYVVPYRAQYVMQRVLEIAARLSIDPTGGRGLDASGLLSGDRETNQCLRWARLNLAQCVAASRTVAEEAYCTGKHGVDEMSDCWGWMVGLDGELAGDEALGN